ncbi:MAG: hypothetical protein JWO69_1223 [Thermoleophilia bacterium]|nr:hypothetical protein [Thermoleophilia bacterium]
MAPMSEPHTLDAPPEPQAPRGLDSLMIQRATPAHVPYLRRLKEAIMADRYRPAADEAGFQQWRDLYCTDEYFADVLADPDSLLLCIGSLREPVGMVVLRRTGTQLEVDDLLVSLPRQGDGTRLLVASLRYAEAWHSERVFIDVYPGNEGVEAFIQSHGFVRADDTTNDLGRPMHRFERSLTGA